MVYIKYISITINNKNNLIIINKTKDKDKTTQRLRQHKDNTR